MAPRATTYLSILSLFLINQIKGQTGKDCWLKTCPTTGQVRIDAIFDIDGNFIGGCNCGCDPVLSDPASPRFCEEPKTINYSPTTQLGDCGCQCPASSPDPSSCKFPNVYDPQLCGCGCPAFAPDPSSCVLPQEFNTQLCQCACEAGSVGGPCIDNGVPIQDSIVNPDCTCNTASITCPGNQVPATATGACQCPLKAPNGAWFPSCLPPLIKDPITCDCATTTTTIPPAGPIEVVCSAAGDCGCPFGTHGTCTIHCEGGGDACKDGLIKCNNDGFDCFVNCAASAGSSCAGAAIIMGPVGGALSVNCLGSNSCEGSVVFNGKEGTDLIVVCDGIQACKGNPTLNFGTGRGELTCNGSPDTCLGPPTFNLINGVQTMPGASFECKGPHCPPNAPNTFSNAAIGGPVAPGPAIPTNPGIGGGGLGTLPAPGVGAGGGTVIITPNQPIPIVLPPEIVICAGTGTTCSCSGNRDCTIKCEEQDDCKEATLNCPTGGHSCAIVCMEKACVSMTVNGPNGGDFVLNCPGMGSCTDSTVDVISSKDTAYTCSGKDSCKGASTLNCGHGVCEVACSGESSCDGAAIEVNHAKSFQCSGSGGCPANFTPPPVPVPTGAPSIAPPPCSHLPACPCHHTQCFMHRDPLENCQCVCPTAILLKEARSDATICGIDATHQVYGSGSCACDCPPNSEPAAGCQHGQQFNQNTCQCECPGGNECPGASMMNLGTCMCGCPFHSPTASDCQAVGKVLRDCQCGCPIQCQGAGQIQSANTCACGCPFGTPTAHECESGIVDELACDCAAPIPSQFCCLTSVPGFKPWQGRCWDEQTEDGCNAEPNGRCVWDPLNCLPQPPHNDALPNQGCMFRDNACSMNEQCCSEVCKVDGTCR